MNIQRGEWGGGGGGGGGGDVDVLLSVLLLYVQS